MTSRLQLGGAPDGDPAFASARTTEGATAIAAELAVRLRNGEAEALADLYRATGSRAFGLAFRIVGEAAAAEDAVQEAFVTLWEQVDRVDPARGRVDSLLMTIVHRRATDHVRRRSRRLARECATDPVEIVDEQPSELLEAVAAAPEYERVHECLRALSPVRQEAIRLAYFGGLSHREIADATGAPLGTVKSRLRLGMEQLREMFDLDAADAVR